MEFAYHGNACLWLKAFPKGRWSSLLSCSVFAITRWRRGELLLHKFDDSGAKWISKSHLCLCSFSYSVLEGCEVGHWSEWGTCSRNNRTCGFKWGLETRTRQIVKKPAKDTIPCPTIAESRRCKMAMRHCPGGRCEWP